MVVVTKNPTAYSVLSCTWVNPEYALGGHDGNCAYTNRLTYGKCALQVSSFGFAIPAGSTLNSVKFGYHAAKPNNQYSEAEMVITHDSGSQVLATVFIGDCTNAGDTEEPDYLGLTIDDLNTENFTVVLRLSNAVGGYGTAYFDCCWIKVDYTPPVEGRPALGDGLTWVQAFRRRRKNEGSADIGRNLPGRASALRSYTNLCWAAPNLDALGPGILLVPLSLVRCSAQLAAAVGRYAPFLDLCGPVV